MRLTYPCPSVCYSSALDRLLAIHHGNKAFTLQVERLKKSMRLLHLPFTTSATGTTGIPPYATTHLRATSCNPVEKHISATMRKLQSLPALNISRWALVIHIKRNHCSGFHPIACKSFHSYEVQNPSMIIVTTRHKPFPAILDL